MIKTLPTTVEQIKVGETALVDIDFFGQVGSVPTLCRCLIKDKMPRAGSGLARFQIFPPFRVAGHSEVNEYQEFFETNVSKIWEEEND